MLVTVDRFTPKVDSIVFYRPADLCENIDNPAIHLCRLVYSCRYSFFYKAPVEILLHPSDHMSNRPVGTIFLFHSHPSFCSLA